MLKQKARDLRKNLTNAERILWNQLRLKQVGGHKYRRQHPLGNYIVDFVCLEKRLVIELDGGQHAEQSLYDENREAWIISQGYQVLRFWNNQIFNELDAVKQTIYKNLNAPHPSLPPQRGEGWEGVKFSLHSLI
jgi:very-short-patch-repair endonuclease